MFLVKAIILGLMAQGLVMFMKGYILQTATHLVDTGKPISVKVVLLGIMLGVVIILSFIFGAAAGAVYNF